MKTSLIHFIMTLITSRCKNKGLSVGRFAFAIDLTSIFKLRKDYNFLNFHLMVESDTKNKTRHMCDPSLIISTIFSVREYA